MILEEALLTLAPDTRSAGHARRFVRGALDEWGCEGLLDVAALLTSELVTNAVLHARTEVQVVMRLGPEALRVEVRDASPRLPVRRRYSTDAATGRGLMLLETMASASGAERCPPGKCVWFEIAGGEKRPEQRSDDVDVDLDAWPDLEGPGAGSANPFTDSPGTVPRRPGVLQAAGAR